MKNRRCWHSAAQISCTPCGNSTTLLLATVSGMFHRMTCPDCQGVLSTLTDGDRTRFRCHTRHAFSADSLLATVTENIEDSLYSAIRGVEESIMLLNHIGDHYAEVNQPKLAAQYFKKANEAETRVQLVRRVVLPHEQLSKDTSEFLWDNLRYHWQESLEKEYPQAAEMLLLMDGGGSNSCLHYIVKEDLQGLANDLEMRITVAHYPAYCSKYNPIEHWLFPHLQRSWEAVVFETYEIVKEQVEKTTTTKGLQVIAWINEKVYQSGRKTSENFKETMTIVFDQVLPKWNYQIQPL